jgi:hypothetical protein
LQNVLATAKIVFAKIVKRKENKEKGIENEVHKQSKKQVAEA